MTKELQQSLLRLSPIQEEAVNWQKGAVLVLAGPGAGKTLVLTTRIARLLDESQTRNFRILALTFTTKAAAEMLERVQILVPNVVEERTFIGTFHAFCAQILRQHGSHLNIRPDFGIFGEKADQEEILKDAIQNALKTAKNISLEDIRWLDVIKKMKSHLITPEKTQDPHLGVIYNLYENALREANILDFEGLILESCKLLAKVPAVGKRIRQTYPYWMIDEFQDTTPAQYWLLHYLAGGEFNDIFIVADDDQIIYQWAGASYRQIEKYRQDYYPALIQLVENHRCPPEIVEIANKLVAKNTQRTPDKRITIPIRSAPLNAISLSVYNTDGEERETISKKILEIGEESWGRIVILARTRSLLEPMLTCLKIHGIRSVLAQRRDNFISPQFVWLQACLDQAIRPTNKRVFSVLVNAANRIIDSDLNFEFLIAEAEASGENYFEHWAKIVSSMKSPIAINLGRLIQSLAHSRSDWNRIVQDAIPILLETASVGDGAISDADDDYRAWNAIMREIRGELGINIEISDVVQGISLRSKEPPLQKNTVALMTIHASKGLEFDIVYIIGLAEGEIPSWQSLKKGDDSPEMEEERRNCFVAITRTKEKLNLSYSLNYRGWGKQPSRFLKEMSLLEG